MSTTTDLNVWYNDIVKKGVPSDTSTLAAGFTPAQMAAYRKDPDDWYLLKLHERIALLAAGRGGVTVTAATTQIKNFQPAYKTILEKRAAALKTQLDAWMITTTVHAGLQSQIDALKQEKQTMNASRQASLTAIQTLKSQVNSKRSATNRSKNRVTSMMRGGPPSTASGASAAPPAKGGRYLLSTA
jgi:hypothetical protein